MFILENIKKTGLAPIVLWPVNTVIKVEMPSQRQSGHQGIDAIANTAVAKNHQMRSLHGAQ
jgi:hypothetical protein